MTVSSRKFAATISSGQASLITRGIPLVSCQTHSRLHPRFRNLLRMQSNALEGFWLMYHRVSCRVRSFGAGRAYDDFARRSWSLGGESGVVRGRSPNICGAGVYKLLAGPADTFQDLADCL